MTTRRPKKGTKRVAILAGQTWRGVTYFEETRFDVSDSYADQLVSEGIARLDEPNGST
jgi:hypothetical protein